MSAKAPTAPDAAAPKRRLRAPARRALIVEAALVEFAARGYDAASMGRVAAAAGVTRTVLYDHFPSKRALFEALLAAKQEELLAHLREALTSDAPTEQRMRATLDAFFAFAEHQRYAWQLLFPERAPLSAEIADEHHRHRVETNRLLAELIAPDARRAGLDPASRTAEAIFALQQAALLGAVRWWYAHPEAGRKQLVDAAMTTLWSGIEGLEGRGRRDR